MKMMNQVLKDNSKYVFEGALAKRMGDDSEFNKWGYVKLLDFLDGTRLEDFKKNENVFIFPSLANNPAGVEDESIILELKKNKQELFTGNIVGFLGDSKGHTLHTLQIKSRFSSDGSKTDFFFQYMLEKVLDVPFMINFGTTFEKQPNMLEWLMLLFPKYLKDAMRKGLFKQYVKREYNDANVRGVIDVPRHIKKNIPFLGKIAYNQREHTVDNELMQLVRHTAEFIKSKSSGANLLANVKNEVGKVIEATPTYSQGKRRRVLIQNKNKPVRHAYYHEYRELQRLCVAILQHETMQIGTGNKEIYGILFDCAWLWEEYLNTLIGNKFHHPENKTKKFTQYLFNGNEGEIYPDFIGRDEENRIIADAKYKPVNNVGKRNHDYFQVLAYMLRFDAKTGYYLYPSSEGTKNQVSDLYLSKGIKIGNKDNVKKREDLKVVKLGLGIPQGVTRYEDFCNTIKDNEKRFINLGKRYGL